MRRSLRLGASLAAAVTLFHAGDHRAPVSSDRHLPLRDAGAILPEHGDVLVGRIAELVEVDVAVRVGRLAVGSSARVEEAAAVALPGEAVAASGAVGLRYGVAQILAAGDHEDMNVAVLGSRLCERHRDALAVRRRNEPSDRRRPAGIDDARVHEHARAPGVLEGGEHDQVGLLLRGPALEREEDAVPLGEARPGRGGVAHELRDAGADPSARGRRVQPGARKGALRLRPCFDVRVVPVFEPAVVIGDVHVTVDVDHGLLGRRRVRRLHRPDGDHDGRSRGRGSRGRRPGRSRVGLPAAACGECCQGREREQCEREGAVHRGLLRRGAQLTTRAPAADPRAGADTARLGRPEQRQQARQGSACETKASRR